MEKRLNPWEVLATAGVVVMETTWLALMTGALSAEAAAVPTAAVFLFLALNLALVVTAEGAFHKLDILPSTRRVVWLVFYPLSTLAGARVLLSGVEANTIDPFTTTLKGIEEITRLLPGEVALALAMAWLLWRGLNIARHGVGTFAVMRSFKLGVGVFLLFSLLALTSERDFPGLEMFFLFIFATLTAMAAARVAVLGKFRGGRRNPFTRSWLGGIVLAVLATVGTGFSLALLTTGRFLVVYQRIIGLILGGIVTLVLSPFLLVIALFMGANIQPVETTAEPEASLPPWEQDPGIAPNFIGDLPSQVEALPPEARPWVYWGAVALFAAAVLLLVWRFSLAARRRGGQVEYAIQPEEWLEYLRKRVRARHEEQDGSRPGRGRLHQRQRLRAAARVRRIYAQLMDLSAEIDLPRPPSHTPLEFLGTLQRGLPAVRHDLATITNAYLKVRYGELPETQAEVSAVEQAWQRTREAAEARRRIVRMQKQTEEKERKRRERRGR